MKKLLFRLAASGTLRIVLSGVALASGIDDLLEAWFRIKDLMHLDVGHGVVVMAFTGILDPLCQFIEQNEGWLRRRSGSTGD